MGTGLRSNGSPQTPGNKVDGTSAFFVSDPDLVDHPLRFGGCLSPDVPDERLNLLDGLLPLYLGKVLSYVKKTERMSLQQAEEHIENECVMFEENKPYITKVWD